MASGFIIGLLVGMLIGSIVMRKPASGSTYDQLTQEEMMVLAAYYQGQPQQQPQQGLLQWLTGGQPIFEESGEGHQATPESQKLMENFINQQRRGSRPGAVKANDIFNDDDYFSGGW